jgi:hypothetical protein
MITTRIRDPKGTSIKDTIEVKLTPLTAIEYHCRECLGNEAHPEKCTSPLCALYHFRTGEAHTGRTMTDEQRSAACARLSKARNAIGKKED